MTDVAALTAFIRARLAEEEEGARNAPRGMATGRWALSPAGADPESPEPFVRNEGGTLALLWSEDDDEVLLAHVARQDPAATLARVAALRALVDMHRRAPCGIQEHGGPEFCDGEDWCVQGERPWPCPTIRHVAAIWRDHPDYQPKWTP